MPQAYSYLDSTVNLTKPGVRIPLRTKRTMLGRFAIEKSVRNSARGQRANIPTQADG